MAHYIVQFTRRGAGQRRGMARQARELLRIGLWGVPPTAQLRPMPGDRVLVAGGAPERVFVGDAVVASGYHRFSPDEASRFPTTLSYDHGIALAQIRVWSHAVPVMAVWPQTVASKTNERARWLGTFTRLREEADAALIIAAGLAGRERGSGDIESVSSAAPEDSGQGQEGVATTLRPTPTPSDVTEGRRGDARGAIDHAARALRSAEEGRAWLPARIAHADWGTAAGKRFVATAELEGGVYHAHAPRMVGELSGLIERLHLRNIPGATTLLGFDFPIGIPSAYAHATCIANFADWLREIDLDSPFFEPADDLAEVSAARPFFPRRSPTSKAPGLKADFHSALGVPGADLLRRCDRAHCDRRAASEMFWTVGPAAVGKTTLAGWRLALRPALAEPGRRYALWPFDGALTDLLEDAEAVIVETYPTEAYRQLGLRMGTPGAAKTRQEDRAADARRLLDCCAENAVTPDDALVGEILDGFGSAAGGDDRFDAVVGLFGMIDTVRRGPEPALPDDPAVRRLEGWMFGQHASCPTDSLARRGTTRRNAATRQARNDPGRDAERKRILELLDRGLPSAHVARRLGIPTMRVAAIKAHMTMGTYTKRSPLAGRPIAETAIHRSPAHDPSRASARDAAPHAGADLARTDHEPPRPSAELHPSDSAIQRSAEQVILESVAAHFGATIAPRTLALASGARVEVDGAARDLSILVEVFARQGALKGRQQKKVCQDALKLITLARSHPNARLVLAFADEQAAAYATTGTWVAEALAGWGVQVLVVDVGEHLRAEIRRAQLRQVMVNPSGVDIAPDDV